MRWACERGRFAWCWGHEGGGRATRFQVSGSRVRLLKRRPRGTREVAPRAQRHGPHLDRVAEQAQPDAWGTERRLGTYASLATFWWAVDALKVTRTKNRFARPNTTG